MRRTSLPSRSILPLSLLLAAACGGDDGADPATVRSRLQETLPGVIDASGRSFTYLGESTALASLDRSLASIDGALALPFTLSGAFADDEGEPLPASDGEELDGAELAQDLAEAVFNDANHEGGGVYRLPGELFCPEDFETGAADPECLASFDEAELRVRVVDTGDGLDLTLLVGPARDEPATLELRAARVTLAVDLAEARQAIVFLASLDGAEVELPDVMEGEVAISLVVHGEDHISLELASRTAVRVETLLAEGALRFATAAKEPLVALEIDAVARAIGLTLDVGATDLEAPWSMIDAASLATGAFDLALGGLSADVLVTDGDETITVANLGLGDATTTATLDGATLLAIDLNAAAGRRFDLTLAPSATGLPTIALAPGLDLSIAVDLGPLAAAGDLVEDYLLAQTYRMTFDGEAPRAKPVEPSVDGSHPGGLAVLAGRLSIGSTAAEAPVVVEAGGCLLADEVGSGEHALIGALAAGACPAD